MQPALLDLLAPWTCPGCGHPRPAGDTGFCTACSAALPGRLWPLRPAVPATAATWACAPYAGPVGAAIRRAKYGGRGGVLPVLGRLLAERVAQAELAPPDLLVPVPAAPGSAVGRGLHHARILALAVGSRLGVPVVDALARRAGGPRLARLDRAARALAVRDAFRLRRRVAGRAWLVDDVVTTGATAGACARLLRAGGARTVEVVALASPRLAG